MGLLISGRNPAGRKRADSCTAILVWLLSCLFSNVSQSLPDSNTIDFSNCTLTLPGTTRTTEARCGWLEVAENPDAPDGNSITLHVALATAVSRAPKPDPLFIFAGGPGQAASEAYVIMQPILEKIRKSRDIVLIDQRGTGQSNSLKCPVQDADMLETSIDLEVISARTRECLEGLEGDPRYYTTTIAMQDYDQVRRAMGYERINLLGISYGTRAAQVYLRQFPDHVRSVILDSVVPMELILGTEHAQMLDRSVAATLADCTHDEHCNELYAEGINGLTELLRQLRVQPREIAFTHPITGRTEPLTVTADVLAIAIRLLSYSSETQAVLPLLIHEAATTGNLERMASQAVLVLTGLNEQLSHGMELSVICSEDYPFMAGQHDDSGTIMGDNFMSVIMTECGIWPHGEPVPDFHAPVTADIPVLLLTGTRDPVTPPSYAERTAAHFPNNLVLIGAGLGHSVITNYCLREIAGEFVELATLHGLDTACVARIKPAPFFTSILGPNP